VVAVSFSFVIRTTKWARDWQGLVVNALAALCKQRKFGHIEAGRRKKASAAVAN